MAKPLKSGAVVYAKNVARVSAFYAAVAGLNVAHTEPDYVVLEAPGFQLVVVAVPARIAASLHLTDPPQRRENNAIKLVLAVPSIGDARMASAALGGQVDSPEREWEFLGIRTCDGHDPEGNVVQFRQMQSGD